MKLKTIEEDNNFDKTVYCNFFYRGGGGYLKNKSGLDTIFYICFRVNLFQQKFSKCLSRFSDLIKRNKFEVEKTVIITRSLFYGIEH